MTNETRQGLQMLGRVLHRMDEATNATGNWETWAEYEAYWLIFAIREAVIEGKL